MKLVHLFLFSVFVGVAFGKKLECLNKEVPICLQNLNITNMSKETNQCGQMEPVVNCIESSSKKCKDDAPEVIKNFVATVRDLCNPDSQTYKDLQKHLPCLQKPEFRLAFLTGCLAEYGEEFLGLGQLDEANVKAYSDKLMNFICPKREKLLNCGYGQIKSQCGEPVEQFIRKLGGPVNELVKESCGDSASIPSISMALIFLHLLIAIFSSRKIF